MVQELKQQIASGTTNSYDISMTLLIIISTVFLAKYTVEIHDTHTHTHTHTHKNPLSFEYEK